MGIGFLVVGLLLTLGGIGVFVYEERKFIIDEDRNSVGTKLGRIYLIAGLVIVIGAMFLQGAIDAWKDGTSEGWGMNARDAFFCVAGAGGFTAANVILWTAFIHYYYKPKLEEKQKMNARRFMFSSIPFLVVFFLLLGQGIADYLPYPFVNGLMFGDNGLFWSKPVGGEKSNFHIQFYAIIMLSGVAVDYAICDHKFFKKYGKHGLLEGLVIVAFLCGVIGARIWYVVGNWTREGFDQNPLRAFEIWTGGLTIIGGAVGGILGGVGYLVLNKKLRFISIPWAMGIVIPTILLAQGIGRWGNFFNCEVHGAAVEISNGWSWLPNWIIHNMQYSSTSPSLVGTNQIYTPLFLIESLLNIGGYFLIVYGIGKPLKKWMADGDLAGCYFIYYGVVRIIMEPMRDPSFNMGTDNNFSIWGSLSYIIIGVVLIAFFELWSRFGKKGKNKPLPPEDSVA